MSTRESDLVSRVLAERLEERRPEAHAAVANAGALDRIANTEALDRIAAALERIADTLDTRQTLDMLGDE